MDAKVGDWVVTPRRGKAVEINALWYNALRLLEGWVREAPRRRRRRAATPTTPTGARRSFNRAVLVRRPAAISTTWSTARTATTRPAGPTSSSPSRWTTRCSTARAGSRSLDVVARAAADAGRPALARARPPRLQAALLRRPARPRRGLSPGDGLGLADRPVHRRLAEGPPRRPRRRAAVSSTASRPTSARRASASISEIFDAEPPYHPRLHRPGLERRRGASLLGQDRRARQLTMLPRKSVRGRS